MVIFFAAVAALILAACPDRTEDSNGSLELSGQVYEREINADLESLLNLENPDLTTLLALAASTGVNYKNYTDSLVIDDSGLGGTGAVAGGKLTYTVEVPSADALQTLEPILDDTELGGLYSNFAAAPEGVMGAPLVLSADNNSKLLTLETVSPFTMEQGTFKITGETVSYIYVERNVTITATGGTVDIGSFMDIELPVSLNTNDINLKLIKGWNSVKAVLAVEYDLTTSVPAATISVSSAASSADTSSLKWTLNTEDQFNQ